MLMKDISKSKESRQLGQRLVWPYIVPILVAFVCLTACSTVYTEQKGGTSGEMEPGDAITILLDYVGGSPEEAEKLESGLAACVQQALKEASQPARLISSDEFRRVLFPGMDLTTAPRSVPSLLLLLKEPRFIEEVDALGVRYIVSITEETSSSLGPVILGAGGYPGVLIAAGAGHKKRTELVARLIDMRNSKDAGTVSARRESVGYYGVVLYVIPVVWPAVTESSTCERLGKEVAAFISPQRERGRLSAKDDDSIGPEGSLQPSIDALR
jgi:hypothetical protein